MLFSFKIERDGEIETSMLLSLKPSSSPFGPDYPWFVTLSSNHHGLHSGHQRFMVFFVMSVNPKIALFGCTECFVLWCSIHYWIDTFFIINYRGWERYWSSLRYSFFDPSRGWERLVYSVLLLPLIRYFVVSFVICLVILIWVFHVDLFPIQDSLFSGLLLLPVDIGIFIEPRKFLIFFMLIYLYLWCVQ